MKQQNSINSLTIFRIVGLICLTISLLALCRSLKLSYLVCQAADWPTTEGRILSSDISLLGYSRGTSSRTLNLSKKPNYFCTVYFTYSVGDKEFLSNKTQFGARKRQSKIEADAFAGLFPIGKSVTVRYNPKKPAQAVCSDGLPTNVNSGMGYSIFFALLGITLILLSKRAKFAVTESR